MSKKQYSIPACKWQVELEVKRSKFLTFVEHASTREQAESVIRQLRLEHPGANHVCWAYIAGSPDTTLRSMSDDGEPSGTAGKPMLNVIAHSGLGEIVVAVVRYFGGTKLGTGGLQRAYSDAVTLAMADLPTCVKVMRSLLTLEYDYDLESVVSRLVSQFDTETLQIEYREKVFFELAVADEQIQECKQALINSCAGKIKISEPD